MTTEVKIARERLMLENKLAELIPIWERLQDDIYWYKAKLRMLEENPEGYIASKEQVEKLAKEFKL